MAGLLTRRSSEMRPRREFAPLDAFRREMDQMLANFFGTDEGFPEVSVPRLDLSETDGEIEICMDAPGVKPEEIDIQLEGDVLTVRGEHTEEKEEKDEGRRFHRIERHSGTFSRSVRLPAAVQEDKIDAELKDGVLRICLPKAEESKPHKIPIKG